MPAIRPQGVAIVCIYPCGKARKTGQNRSTVGGPIFPLSRMIPDRSSPSRVRFAAAGHLKNRGAEDLFPASTGKSSSLSPTFRFPLGLLCYKPFSKELQLDFHVKVVPVLAVLAELIWRSTDFLRRTVRLVDKFWSHLFPGTQHRLKSPMPFCIVRFLVDFNIVAKSGQNWVASTFRQPVVALGQGCEWKLNVPRLLPASSRMLSLPARPPDRL